jgi:2-keto-4-pentenoate hydratase/2-oxohepta-3-ene-1,7-dioic acid hydratase in catechol pathway
MDKIVCVGKNYLEHASELGDAIPEMPVLFLKPRSSLRSVEKNEETVEVEFPKNRGSLHHECEIVIRLSKGGSHLSLQEAKEAIQDVTLGLDMTLRDVQTKLKKNGHPWEMGKVFVGSAILGPWVQISDFPNFENTQFSFSLEGRVRQKGRASEMRLSIPECIVYASQHFPLCPGDLIFTGTPAGVGEVNLGQTAELNWTNRIQYKVKWI